MLRLKQEYHVEHVLIVKQEDTIYVRPGNFVQLHLFMGLCVSIIVIERLISASVVDAAYCRHPVEESQLSILATSGQQQLVQQQAESHVRTFITIPRFIRTQDPGVRPRPEPGELWARVKL